MSERGRQCFDNGCAGCDECCDYEDYEENAAMPKTVKERQEDFRARRAMLEGATEVRGIFLPPELHAELKKLAQKISAKFPRKSETTGSK